MTTYLVLYRRPAAAPDPMADPDPQAMAEGKAAWGAWLRGAGDAVVDFGSPTFPVEPAEGPDRISGFTILQAGSRAELEWLLSTHPHRTEGSFEVHAFARPPGA
ncbi:MAG: hypothetical protein ABS62_10265 [Microbacterium sp. SCN 70-200]|uniref:hypothetical protein n=1 Tax=unclassified Microbacterium TaxID=2609290 RepID=UPI00086C5051|nr:MULTISPECIES: hypothetical protein [unclassified Microbacterium]MBN9213335.1 hypothetical protein [Microbacterium sp.]ODT40542.1 MAG: hypothetical protein ABS62_10265 [Microbacterium sp. SCN 70-200]OJV84986.1 MAG: hypothetical protein BGO46_10315 [Microbacterium sp. 70-16]